MKKDVKKFLESSLLEEYVLGVIDSDKISLVESYIQSSPEVKAMYQDLQDSIEQMARKLAILPPPETRDNRLQEINKHNVLEYSYKGASWWRMAASLAVAILLIGLVIHYNQKNNLQSEFDTLQNQLTTLQDQCKQRELLYAIQQKQWQLLADPKTKRHLLAGNNKAPELEAVAYWNNEKQSAYIQLFSYPDLPKGKCIQLWADVDGEMISLNVIPNKTGQVISIPFKKDATSLNITIEPDGGSDHPTVEDLVASVTI